MSLYVKRSHHCFACDVNLVRILEVGVKYFNKSCNPHKCWELNFISIYWFFAATICIVKMILYHQGINRGKCFAFVSLIYRCNKIFYWCWIFCCWWVILYLVFDHYGLISKHILTILFFHGFGWFNFYYFFISVLWSHIDLVTMIPNNLSIKKGKCIV